MTFKFWKKKTLVSLGNKALKDDINRNFDTWSWHFLTYRGLRIIGWIAMCFTSITTVLVTFANGSSASASLYGQVANVTSLISTLAIPCFLVANFAIIFRQPKSTKKLLATYGSLVILMALINYFFLYRYIIVLSNGKGGTPGDFSLGYSNLTYLLNTSPSVGTILNMFVDMFLCVLFYFFYNYKPKKVFVGKKLIVFRCMAAIPFIYEFTSLILRTLSIVEISNTKLTISPFIFPFLCTKPPYMFLSFMAICIFMDIRKKRLLKKGMSEKEYEKFLDTEENLSDFNTLLSATFLGTVIIDYIAFGICLSVFGTLNGGDYYEVYKKLLKIGIGSSVGMVMMVPILKVFSYKREVNKTSWEPLIPLIGIILYILMGLEAAIDILTTR